MRYLVGHSRLPATLSAGVLMVVMLSPSTGRAARFYVATDGSDANPGTIAAPLATLQAAQTNVRAMIQGGLSEAVDVIIRGGTYYLDSPLELRPEDSGTAAFPITWRAATNETVALSGGKPITNIWITTDGTNWVVNVPGVTNGWNFRQLFVNGTRARRARFPNADEANPFLYATGGGWDHVIVNPALIKASWGTANDAQINIVPQSRFFNQWNTVTNVDTTSGRIDIANSERHRTIDSGSWFWIEGVREEMDRPGEWFMDRAAGQLHYRPEAGVDPNTLAIVAPYLNRIVNAQGDVNADTHVAHVRFEGLDFRHTSFSLGHIEARTHTDAAIMFENTSDSSVSNCRFENIGGYALWLHLDSQRNVFRHNTVLYSGGGGVLLTGARFAYMDDTKIYTPGEAAAKVAPILNEITFNTVEHCGQIRYYGGGVHLDSRPFGMSMAPGNLIAHNHFSDLSRNGIFAFRNQGGNVVEYNHIHNSMQTTVDGACIHFATMNHLNAPNYILNNWLYDIWGYEQKPNGNPVRHLANGVFLDWDTSNTTVQDNWVYNSGGEAFKYIWDNWKIVSSGNQSSSTLITPPFVAEVGPGGTATHGIDLANNKLTGSVVHYTDTSLVSTSGTWAVQSRTGLSGLFVFDFLRASGGSNEARYTLPITRSGNYQISLLYKPEAANASDALVRIQHADGTSNVRWNMQNGSQHGFAVEIGKYNFETGQTATVTLSTDGATGYVVADSVAFVRTGAYVPPVVVTPPVNGVLLNHDFTDEDDGVGLNGRPADVLSIADGAQNRWVAGGAFGADGDIAGSAGTKQTAYFDIGSAITKGSIDSVFELEVVMQVAGAGTPWLSAGFFNTASPNTAQDPTANGGTGWFLWRGNGEVEVRTGVNANGKLGDNETVSTASVQTFTIRLDLSGWDGIGNFGNLSVYHGTSSSGTRLYSGASPAALTSDNDDFLAAGFSAAEQSGKINRFKITQVGDAHATGSMCTVTHNGIVIAVGATNALPTTTSGTAITREYVISNLTSATTNLYLTNTPAVVFGENSQTNYNGFTIITNVPPTAAGTNLAAGEFAAFTLEFVTSVAGSYTATVRIANSDTNKNPYAFKVTATAVAPGVALSGARHVAAAIDMTTLTDVLLANGDWAIWEGAYTEANTYAPTDRKSGGAGLIGDLTKSGSATGISGSVTAWGPGMQWTDGTTVPVRAAAAINGGGVVRPLDTVGASLTVEVSAAANGANRAYFWVGVQNGAARFRAALPGASDYVATNAWANAIIGTGGTLYVVDFTPGNPASDKLTVTYELIADTGADANVRLGAVALGNRAPSQRAAVFIVR